MKNRSREIDDVDDEEMLAFMRGKTCRSRGDYVSIADSWLSVFPNSSLFIGFHDAIVTPCQQGTDWKLAVDPYKMPPSGR